MTREWEITCVTQSNNVITHVGIEQWHLPIETVIYWVQNGMYKVYTHKKDKKTLVYAKQSSNGNWFLTTEPDSTKENNLDFLPTCEGRY